MYLPCFINHIAINHVIIANNHDWYLISIYNTHSFLVCTCVVNKRASIIFRLATDDPVVMHPICTPDYDEVIYVHYNKDRSHKDRKLSIWQ